MSKVNDLLCQIPIRDLERFTNHRANDIVKEKYEFFQNFVCVATRTDDTL